jgi:hypothetical protein
MEKCKYCSFAQLEDEWLGTIGLYDHGRTGHEDPNQYVECPMCLKILHIDYDIISAPDSSEN